MSKKTNDELAAIIDDVARKLTEAGALREAAARFRQQSEDSARLDWLSARCTGASDSERYLPFRVFWGDGRGIRAAIDKARES